MNLTDYIAAAPEMTLLGLICVVMIADLFVDDEDRADDHDTSHGGDRVASRIEQAQRARRDRGDQHGREDEGPGER